MTLRNEGRVPLAVYAKRIKQLGRPAVEIRLDDNNDTPVTYTTGSAVSGKVHITATHNECFDEIQITFEGSTKVGIDQMSQVSGHSKIEATHNFLKLTMPVPEALYPTNHVAEAGEKFTIPFNFVVPDQLLPTCCRHKYAAPNVHATHTRLPPSMGDPDLSPACDLCPEMCRISYSINAKVVRFRDNDARAVALASAARKLHIIPVMADEPPMHVEDANTEYALIRTKDLKKGMFKGRLGSVTMSATQPSAIALNPTSADRPATTVATIKLRFDPADATCQPPKLGTLHGKLKGITFAAAKPQQSLAHRTVMLHSFDPSRGCYSQVVALTTLKLDSTTAWTFHAASPVYQRRDSGYETAGELGKLNSAGSALGHYEATIYAPLALPSNKTWLPTFHTCLVSRIYGLDFTLTVNTAAGKGMTSTLGIRLPIQLSSSTSEMATCAERRASHAAVLTEGEIDDHLRPRMLSMPNQAYSSVNAGPAQPLVEEQPPDYVVRAHAAIPISTSIPSFFSRERHSSV